MEWRGQQGSSNVEDRRAIGGAGMALGGGGIIIALLAYFLTGDPAMIGKAIQQGQRQQGGGGKYVETPREKELAEFSGVILKSTEEVWTNIFREQSERYQPTTLVLYRGATQTACGTGQKEMGPFYCPADAKVYLDLSFFDEMEKRMGIPGELARAYVIAHEVGHHVQHLKNYTQRLDRSRRAGSESAHNLESVRVELMADYLAGVWAHHSRQRFKINEADFKSAINAAHKIGVDYLSKGRLRPENFTHGSSEQRMRFFAQGFKTGDFNFARKILDLPESELR